MEPGDPNSASGGQTQNVSVPPVEGVSGGGTSYGWVDGGLRGSSLGASVIDPTKVHSKDLLHVWSLPSTANVSQNEAPRPLEKVNLLAARNERESFQIALRPKVSWATSGIAGSVQIQCTDLCSSSGDRLVVGQSITLRRVVPILGVPDALVPIDPLSPQISLHPGETTAVWVSLNVPCGQPPGVYEGEIFITAVKTEADSRTEVLPKSERYRLYQELRSCLDITEPRDYSSSEETVFCSDTTCYKISETVIEDRFCLEHGAEGWYDALDRHFRWLLQYRISPFFCRWGDGMRILAYTCPWPGIACEWVLGTREDLVKDIVSELRPDLGEEWWTYVCMGPSDPQPNWHLGMRGTQHRAVLWRVWKEGGTGFLYWGTNCYEKAMIPSAEICFRRGLPPGDGVLFYPGEVFSSSHEPVASTRLERILSGMQDIEYLKLYSARYGRDEALALLEKTGVYLAPDRYTLDHGPVDVMRGEVYRTCRS
ncbi:hypothetical protein PR202_ga29390 [Eleusine coracana subsp. coracana]|uniref:Glycoside hydrolase 123 catalytic domain-containing protein n=1 Tax=Eleusine coracana subsp. coracana TaxID=191504 RepID=A0AAV5DLX7_ELECO|nr:hypothetical protein PR202_ga29390 [Eleusine coracana subsp. coracana]